MKQFLFVLLLPALSVNAFADRDLTVAPEDIRILQTLEGGYFLWIRRKPDIASVLLTESSADPNKRSHSFTLRNPHYHPLNGDERRVLDGKVLESNTLFFLMDSSPEPHPELGEAFQIFIPYVVVYGYPWSREGQFQVLDGTFLNIRAFSKGLADYEGPYADNPFRLKVTQLLVAEPEGNYMPETEETFAAIAQEGGGQVHYSTGEDDLVDTIGRILTATGGRSLDLVLALDTTRSMHNDMPALKTRIVPLIREHTDRFERFRVGLLYYRDYFEAYLTQALPFADTLATIQSHIDRVRVLGGRDIPEAVFEALYTGIHNYDWLADSRMIILIGDAPPHPLPRGKITKEMVYRDAEAKQILINTIILPQ